MRLGEGYFSIVGNFFFIILLGLVAIIAGAVLVVGIFAGIVALCVGVGVAKASSSRPKIPPKCLPPKLPAIGERLQVKRGAMKGRYGTVVAREGTLVVIEDRAGRRAKVPISDF